MEGQKEDDDEIKPFWGAHRLLETAEWLKNMIYCSVGSASIWATENDLIDYEYINAQVSIGVILLFNMYYYFRRHVDSSFGFKTILWVANTLLSLWYVIGMAAILLRLSSEMSVFVYEAAWGLAVLCELGVIIISSSIVSQLVELVEGSISYAITCIALRERNQRRRRHRETPTSNVAIPHNMNSMLENLRKARSHNTEQVKERDVVLNV